MQVFKSFTFDSAHFLPNVPDGHRCKNMHGHTYRLTVFLDGPLVPPYDWVIDFGEVKKVVAPIVDRIDHHLAVGDAVLFFGDREAVDGGIGVDLE